MDEADAVLKSGLEGLKAFPRMIPAGGMEMLMRLYFERGDFEEAERYRLEAIAAAREIGDVNTQRRLQEAATSSGQPA